ncbi:DEAD/DEAH box helicase [Bacteroides acidifaciens]|uniref:DEAD/DEAH box helicase n=1 Tax=Bacteroides acidifaciens TaxID=85831 RepID=UPI00249292D9|nr:DEAD/DEAH box helicase [Bacteroides acidifaciens]
MKERPTNGRVIIVFTEHPIFGILLIPYIAERLNDGTLQLVEQAFHASSEAISMMSEAERQAIDIASYYTEKYLMGLYSREKTVSRFLHKLSKDPARIKNHIRPFIEKKLLEMLALIRENGLPFYQKQAGSKILYAHHAYHINPHDVEIRVTFHVDSKTFRYQLQCYYEGQSFSLSELKPVVVLTSSPVTLLLGMELYFFPHIESARILAFTKKRSISVDASQIEKYIDNIVIPIARYHEIETHGLNIMEEKCVCEAILSFEDVTYNGQALQLGFRYRDQIFTPDSAIEMKKIVYRKTSGEICFFRRNMIMEEQAVQLLTDAGLQQLNNTYFSLSPKTPEKTLVEWINNHRELLQQSFHLINNAENARYSLDEIHIEQSCDNEVDWFELHITVVIGNLRIPFSRFRKHILEEKREYLLPDGRMILLPEEWFSKYANLLEMGIQTEKGIRLKHTFIGAVQTALGENGIKKIPAKQQIRKVAVPKTLKATLRPYQQKGFSWMVHLYKRGFGGCLADDMGLGKTLQTLTLLQYIYKPSAPKQPATLIVVPTSLLHNWRREAKRFTALSMTEYNNTVAIDKKRPEKFFGRFHLIFTTYGMMKNNIDILRSYRFKYVVLDESQNIKNSDSLNFRSAIQLQSNHRLVLTGTPIENSLKDLWAQFHFIQPDLLGSESAFQKQFIIPIRQGNARVETQLQQLIAPFILRRSKKEVAPELPELTEETIYCDMTGEQNTCYEQEKNSLRNILLQHTQSTDRLHSFSVLNGILRLRQLSCHPQLIFPDYTGTSGKATQIIETFDTLQSEGHKVLIFSSFVKHLELLAEAFRERGWKYALLTGSTSNRSSEIAHFTDQKDVQAFLISLKAGGVGLNLTQADYVFIIDPWWNPAAESQAIARAHRIGQDKQVIAYRFITQNSIEEKILHLQDEKRRLAETFVADSESLPILSNEQWVDLL